MNNNNRFCSLQNGQTRGTQWCGCFSNLLQFTGVTLDVVNRREQVHDCTQSFVFALKHYERNMYRQNLFFFLASSSVGSKHLLCFVQSQGQNANKNIHRELCD